MPDRETIIYVRPMDAPGTTTRRPQYVYEGRCPVNSDIENDPPDFTVICQVTSNVNESTIWCHDDCATIARIPTQLRKSFQSQGTQFARVWQDVGMVNMTTGRVESDPKKFREHLHRKSREMEERLGMPVDYQPAGPDETFVSDEGLDATHDEAVKSGRKDSRGRFVWQM